MAVDKYLATRAGAKPLGVYALYNENEELQYVGYSRNVVLAIRVGWRGGQGYASWFGSGVTLTHRVA